MGTWNSVEAHAQKGQSVTTGWRIPNYSDFWRFWPPIFPLEIDEHDQPGAKDTKRERSVTEAYCTKT
jgi:hypothetical protein